MRSQRAIFIERSALVGEESFAGGVPSVALRAGVVDAIAALRRRGWRIVVTSNERRVASGALTEPQVQELDAAIASLAVDDAAEPLIDRFYWCPFDPEASEDRYRREHGWRKPATGMFEQAAADLDLSLEESWVIASTREDAAAARSLGCRCVRIGPPPANAPAAIEGREFESSSPAEAAAFIAARGEAPKAARLTEIRPARAARSTVTALPPPLAESVEPPRSSGGGSEAPRDLARLEQSLRELAEELRLRRAREREFSGLQVVAIALQLAVLLSVVMGLLQWSEPEALLRWFLGAVVLQLTAIAMLLLDRR
jgi:D-glycero-D-manno-heptose 1,7-bisphosphate phosphatase